MIDKVPSFNAVTQGVEAAPSLTHGIGLYARAPLANNSIVSFYPVHALGGGGKDGICLMDSSKEENSAYFGVEGSAPYRVTLSHREMREGPLSANDVWIDANPLLPDKPGWLAHRANDAAVCESGAEDAILSYYATCRERTNAYMVPFGDAMPLMCLWTTRPIEAGEEILWPYGHDYWIDQQGGTVPPFTEPVLRAAKDSGKGMRAANALQEHVPEELAMLEGLMRPKE